MTQERKLSTRRQKLFDRLTKNYSEHLAFDGDKLLKVRVPSHHPVSTGARQRLIAHGIPAPEPSTPARTVTELEDFILAQDNSDLQKVGFGRQVPKDVHYIPVGKRLFFDFRSADLLMEDLSDGGLNLKEHAVGLDFGCSTGRTVRTLAAGLSHMDWIGVDPVPSSIRYAANRFPKHTWVVNEQEPPMPIEDNTVDFVLSKSVWTHFSAAAGIAWIRDIERILKPGGLVAITVHGWHDLARRVFYNMPNPPYQRLAGVEELSSEDYLHLVADEMEESGFHFRPYVATDFQADLGRLKGSQTSDWGLTFMTKDWATKNLASSGLELKKRSIARNGHRHDVLIFQKV